MLVLSLDSTSTNGSAAIWRDGALVDVRPTDPARGFSEQLPAAMIDLLETHGLCLADVTVFAVASGPGSLTGLRVGIATVQGFALAADKPVVAVSALDATARAAWTQDPVPAPGSYVAAWRDARRGEIFSCLYRVTSLEANHRLEVMEPPAVGPPAGTFSRWRELGVSGQDLLLIGDAAPSAEEPGKAILGGSIRVACGFLLAGVVAAIAAEQATRGQAVRPHAVQPLYVRKPDAELARDRAVRDTDDPGRTPSSGRAAERRM